MPSVFPPIEAGSIAELAKALDLAPDALATVVERIQSRRASVVASIPAVWTIAAAKELDPPKSHWARPHRYAALLRLIRCGPGITFTYLGVTVDEDARVIMHGDRPAKNIFAAGEMMAGNILGKGYLAGFGLTIGAVFGRIAGREAARYVGYLSCSKTASGR